MHRTPYRRSRFTEAQMQEIDEAGERATTPTGPTLADYAKQPATAQAIAAAHAAVPAHRWNVLSVPSIGSSANLTDTEHKHVRAVWATLPGSTCMFDAIRLIARTA